MRQTVGILGTPIDILNTQEVLARLEQFIQERRFHQVATANTDFLINALSDPELRHILQNADLVMPDGMPVVWAARLMRSRLPERVTGADIVPDLAGLAAKKGYRVYMLGARPDVAQKAKARLEAEYPGLQIVGCVSPPNASLIEMDSGVLLDDIARANPDILLVAFGNPKQEKWIHLHRERLRDVPLCIGVGGTFDFLAGKVPRAPVWMRNGGLEWIHRLCHEPRRLWKRYVRDILQFGRYLSKQWWAIRHSRNAGSSEMHTANVGGCTVLSVIGDFDKDLLPRFQSIANAAIDLQRHLVLDLQKVTGFDGEALGTLINLSKRAAHAGVEVRLFALPATIAAALRRSQLHDRLFHVSATVAQALLHSDTVGMSWQVKRGQCAAVMAVSGASEPLSARRLEETCAHLLAGGKRLDLDLRDLDYADSHLLSALYRLQRTLEGEGEAEPRFRIVAGAIFARLLAREKMTGKFVTIEMPEMPLDAVEERTETMLDRPEELPVTEPNTLYAQGG